MSDALIIDACRTPRGIGKPGKGALAHLHPQRLAASVLAAIAERNDLDTSKVDDIIWGTSNQPARRPATSAAWVPSTPATTSRRAASRSTASAAAASRRPTSPRGMIVPGSRTSSIAGGTDMMSTYAANRVPGLPPFMDAGNTHLRSIHPQPHQGICGDAIATLEGIPRDALDDLAFESQQRAAQRDRRRPIRAQPDHGAQRRRHRRPRPRRVPPAADHREGLPVWRPRSPASTTCRSTKAARRSSRSSPRCTPTSRSSTSTTPATAPASSTAPRDPVGQPGGGEGQRLDAAGPPRRDGQRRRQPDADAQRARSPRPARCSTRPG